jgi:hypothetical protein
LLWSDAPIEDVHFLKKTCVNYTVLDSNRWNAVFVTTTVQDWEINAMQISKKNGIPPRVEVL